jgi:hypothetical protein
VCDGFSQTCSIDKTVTTTAPCTSPVHGSVFNRAAVSDDRAVLHAAKSKEAIRVKQGDTSSLFSFHINQIGLQYFHIISIN